MNTFSGKKKVPYLELWRSIYKAKDNIALAKSTHMKCIAPDKALFSTQKVSIFFLLLDENICCGYSLEVPH